MIDHSTHGRGTENGPDDPDCPCRGSVFETACAQQGCGFCRETTVPILRPPPNYAELADWIKWFSVALLARRMHVSQGTVYSWLKWASGGGGGVPPRPDLAADLERLSKGRVQAAEILRQQVDLKK